MKLSRLTPIVIAALAFIVVSTPAFATKVNVCHRTGNGTYHLIVISTDALSAHEAHGDGEPGNAVPNMSGYIFGDNCAPTLAPPPELAVGCYTITISGFSGTFSYDISYLGPIDTLGNIVAYFGSSDRTCSGTGFSQPGAAFIASDNSTDAQTKCNTLTGQTGTTVVDLGTALSPSESGFWGCAGNSTT